MIVTIPKVAEHNGSPLNLMTIEISDKCPKCGAKRGTKVWEGLSYDGSRRLGVTQWENECGHTDTYAEVREEYYNTPMKGKTLKEHLSESDNCCCKEGLVCSVHDDYIGMQS